jgi:hypothetical protein
MAVLAKYDQIETIYLPQSVVNIYLFRLCITAQAQLLKQCANSAVEYLGTFESSFPVFLLLHAS